MRIFALLAVLIVLLAAPVRAQEGAPALPAIAEGMDGEITAQPLCFNVLNKAPYSIVGTFSTNIYTTPEGIQAHHRANFRLGPEEQTNSCSSGPFYKGRKLDMVLKSLVPLFAC